MVRLSALRDGKLIASRDFPAADRQGQLVSLDPGVYEVRVEGLFADAVLLRGIKTGVVVESAQLRDAGEFLLAPVAPRSPELSVAPPAVTSVAELTLTGSKEMFTGLRVDGNVVIEPTDEATSFSTKRKLVEGANEIKFVTFTSEQAESAATIARVTLDRTPPVARIFRVVGNATAVSSTTITLEIGAEGATEMMIAADSAFAGGTWLKYEESVTLTLPGQDGVTTLYARFRDAVGNVSTALSLTVALDRQAPSQALLSIAGAPSYVTTTALLLNPSASGATQMRIWETNEAAQPWVAYATAAPFVLSGTEGNKTIFARFRDAAGNTSPFVSTAVVLDQTPPTAPSNLIANPLITNGPISLNWDAATDTGSGVEHYIIEESTDGILWSFVNTQGGLGYLHTQTAGTFDFRVSAKDYAGNIGPAVQLAGSVVVDTTPPVPIAIEVQGAPAFVNSTSITVALNFSDATEMQLSEQSDFVGAAWVPAAFSAPFTLSASQTEKTIWVRFRDAAGNVSDPINTSVILDMTPPTIDSVALAGGAAYVNSNSQTLSISATGGPVAMNFAGSLQETGWRPYAPVTAVTLALGQGYRQYDFEGVIDIPKDITLLASGDLLVTGAGGSAAFATPQALTRKLVLDGSLAGDFSDAVFGNAIENDTGYSVLEQTDGKIVVAGSRQDSGNTDWFIARYLADGSVDTSFNGTGFVIYGGAGNAEEAVKILAQPDGKLIAVGTFDTGVSTNIALLRLNTDGSTDVTATTSIAPSGSKAADALLQTDGSLVVVGDGVGALTSDIVAVRFDQNMAYIDDVRHDITGTHDFAVSVIAQSDGSLAIVGYSQNIGDDIVVVRLTPSLTLIDTPTVLDFGGMETPYDAALLPDDKLIIVGKSGSDWTLVRTNADGTADESFGWSDGHMNRGFGVNVHAASVAAYPDGRFAVAGIASSGAPAIDWMIARFLPNGDFDPTFGPSVGGTANIDVTVRDAAGNVSIPLQASVVLDNVPPDAPSGLEFSANPSTGPVTISWSPAYDAHSGIDHYVVEESTDGFTWYTLTTTTDTGVVHFPGDGEYYYRVYAVDLATNVGTFGASGTLTIDLSPPTVGIVSDFFVDKDISNTLSLLEAYWSGFDDLESGIDHYEWALGTAPGTDDLLAFTNVGTFTSGTNAFLPLVSGTTYYATVRAYNGAGAYVEASSDGILVDNVAPPFLGMPAVFPQITSTGTVTISWGAVADADSSVAGYRVKNNLTLAEYNTVTTSVTVSGIAEGTYTYSVQVSDVAGNQSIFSVSSLNVVVDMTPPSQPGQPSFTSNPTSGGVTIMWSPASDSHGIDYYAIEESSDGGFTWIQIATTPNDFYGVAPLGGNYLYRVLAVDMAGNPGSYSTDSVSLIVDTTPPLAGMVEDGSIGDYDYTTDSSSLQGNWVGFADFESGIVDYQIAIGSTPGFDDVYAFTSVGVTGFAMASGLPLNSGTTYYFTVRAVNGAGLTFDATSDGIMVDYNPPPTPAQPTVFPTMTSTGTVTVSWSPVIDLESGTTGYQVVNQTSFDMFSTAGTSVTETGLGDGIYTYTVTVTDAANNYSAPSVPSPTVIVDKTPPSMPGVPSFPPSTTGPVIIAWGTAGDSGVGLADYTVLESINAGATWYPIGVTVTNSFHIVRLPGTYHFKIRARDLVGNISEGLQSTSLTATAVLGISPAAVTVPVGKTFTFSASGGTPPYSFSVASGGGTINSSTGQYFAPGGPDSVIVRVTDAALLTADATVDVAITAPQIALLSPTAGTANTTVTISGMNFGPTQGASTVYFGGVTAPVIAWSDTSIQVYPAHFAAPGTIPVHVVKDGEQSNGELFEHIRPWIDLRYPLRGTGGTTVNLVGRYFGAVTGVVTIGAQPATVLGWNDTNVQLALPGGLPAGITTITVSALDTPVLSNAVPFTKRGNNMWLPMSDVPQGRSGHTAVWTGSEMIIWGGATGTVALKTGGRYNPATDSWLPTQTSPQTPSVRFDHAAVWTGRTMVVFGGFNNVTELGDGGRYDPASDTWLPMNNANKPTSRRLPTAVWTGERVVVWGGKDSVGVLNDGAMYRPDADIWDSMDTQNVPAARYQHTAVWDGSRMIVWGGFDNVATYFQTGALFEPKQNRWYPMAATGAPVARGQHVAVWTGEEMLVWGGVSNEVPAYHDDGGRYNPLFNTWSPLLADGNTPVGRAGSVGVWTGDRLIVWGGDDGVSFFDDGGEYFPATGLWAPLAGGAGPSARVQHTAVWTGEEMIVWGGRCAAGCETNSGGRYNPQLAGWVPTAIDPGMPEPRFGHKSVWTGPEMIVWGGAGSAGEVATGGRYNPAIHSWQPTSMLNAPAPRTKHTAVWTGSEMLVYGGFSGIAFNDLSRYDPALDTWTTEAVGPSARYDHTAVYAGDRMIVWGGYNGSSYLGNGSAFDPVSNLWTAIDSAGAPGTRSRHSAVWTGTDMIVWGGYVGTYLNTGGRYTSANDTWTSITQTGAPFARTDHTAVWTGAEMIVFGGGTTAALGNGARYNPSLDSWATMVAAPVARKNHVSAWTGSELIVFGGWDTSGVLGGGAAYDPVGNAWRTLPNDPHAPLPREGAAGVWTGSEFIVWGGSGSTPIDSGAIYVP